MKNEDFGVNVAERDMSLVELQNAHDEGRLLGVFTTSSEHGVQSVKELAINSEKSLHIDESDIAKHIRANSVLNKTHHTMTPI